MHFAFRNSFISYNVNFSKLHIFDIFDMNRFYHILRNTRRCYYLAFIDIFDCSVEKNSLARRCLKSCKDSHWDAAIWIDSWANPDFHCLQVWSIGDFSNEAARMVKGKFPDVFLKISLLVQESLMRVMWKYFLELDAFLNIDNLFFYPVKLVLEFR